MLLLFDPFKTTYIHKRTKLEIFKHAEGKFPFEVLEIKKTQMINSYVMYTLVLR